MATNFTTGFTLCTITYNKRADEEVTNKSNSKEKSYREKWGEDEEKVKLDTAIKEWNTGRKCGLISLLLKEFSWLFGISYKAFEKYVARNYSNHRFCDSSVRRAPLVKRKDQYYLDNVLARKDQSNAAGIKAESIDLVLDLDIFLTQEQER